MSITRWIKSVPLLLIAAGTIMVTPVQTGADRADEAVRIASKKITSEDPMERAQAVDDLARANNKEGTAYILKALEAEGDGPAGFAMAKSIAQLTSEEALEQVEKTIGRWNTPSKLFGAYWMFLGLSQQRSENGDKFLRKIFEDTKDRDIYLRAALVEALAEGERHEMGDILLEVLKSYDSKWDEQQPIIVTTMVRAAPRMTGVADKEMRKKVVLALADILEQTESRRIEWFTTKALSEITGEDTYTDPEFWRWWVELGGHKAKKGDGATAADHDVPKFFESGAVGKRVVFVIDISESMTRPVNLPPEMKKPPEKDDKRKGPVTGKGGDRDKEEAEEEIPPPDYSGVNTKLDLAKVELIHTLKHLPEDYYFNIVIYETEHRMIDQSNDKFVPANRSNKSRFIKKVEGLSHGHLTNIYGALRRGFCVNMKNTIDPDKVDKRNVNNPAWDPECLLSGATTMFFLTDGSPTVTDDTIGEVTSGQMAQGAARYCQPNNILWEIKRLNTFRKCVINTVGIGPHYGPLMDAIARLTGGEYIDRSGVADR